MKLTDINSDCLETIFEYLDFGDLLNVADANKCLKNVACTVYFRNYRHKEVLLIEARHYQCRVFKILINCINVNDLKTSLQLLRCFGGLISEIVFYSRGDAYHNGKRAYPDLTQYILGYVNEYCVESLISVTFYEDFDGIIKHLKNSFKKVEKVSIKQGVVPENIRLNELFPNMRELYCICFSFTSYLTEHFPNLQHLDVTIWQTQESIKSKNEMKTILCLNPQLKSLRINSPGIQRFLNPPLLTAIVLDDAQDSLQNLETLTMHGTYFSGSKFEGDPIHLRNVKHFNIHLQGLLHEPLPRIPISFGQLESFKLQYITNFDDEFYKFVERHPTIKKLIISYDSPKNDQYQSKLAYVLPKLTDIEICNGRFSIDDILRFLNDFKVLRCINVNLIEHIEFNELEKRLNVYKDWQASIEHKSSKNQRIFLNRKLKVTRN